MNYTKHNPYSKRNPYVARIPLGSDDMRHPQKLSPKPLHPIVLILFAALAGLGCAVGLIVVG